MFRRLDTSFRCLSREYTISSRRILDTPRLAPTNVVLSFL